MHNNVNKKNVCLNVKHVLMFICSYICKSEETPAVFVVQMITSNGLQTFVFLQFVFRGPPLPTHPHAQEKLIQVVSLMKSII